MAWAVDEAARLDGASWFEIYLLLAIPFVAVLVFPVATAGGVFLTRELLAAK